MPWLHSSAGGSRVSWQLWLVLGGFALAFLALGLSAVGQRRWTKTTTALAMRLDAGRLVNGVNAPPTRYHASELDGLPAPVQRFFRAALTDGQPIIAAVRIDIAGTFNMSPVGAQWKPFSSHQRVVTRRPGFLWDAKIALFPGITVRVVDSYIVGKGLLHAAIQGLFTMADIQGEGEIARGEFMRWFAEVAWYPTALLPSQGVRWEAVDEHCANASFRDGPLTLTLLFRFNEAGLIGSFRADARGGMVGGKMLMAPWEGIWSDYRAHGGMQVPFKGEVAWMRPEGRKPYFIGTVTALAFEFSP